MANPNLGLVWIDALGRLRAEYEIPTSAVNVIIEAMSMSKQETKDTSDIALLAYRNLNQLSPDGPDEDTFASLISGSCTSWTAYFVAEEMHALLPDAELAPNLINKLAMNCAIEGELGLAITYLQKLDTHRQTRRIAPRSAVTPDLWVTYADTVQLITQKLLVAKDRRFWRLMEEVQRRNPELHTKLSSLNTDGLPGRADIAQADGTEQAAAVKAI
jgi:hypothetical protein